MLPSQLANYRGVVIIASEPAYWVSLAVYSIVANETALTLYHNVLKRFSITGCIRERLLDERIDLSAFTRRNLSSYILNEVERSETKRENGSWNAYFCRMAMWATYHKHPTCVYIIYVFSLLINIFYKRVMIITFYNN